MFDDATLSRYDARQAPAVETPIATLWQEFEHNRERPRH